MKIDIHLEEMCYCNKGTIEVKSGDKVYGYICQDCDGSGWVHKTRRISIKQFKKITGAKDAKVQKHRDKQ